jgi:hypothetical protein
MLASWPPSVCEEVVAGASERREHAGSLSRCALGDLEPSCTLLVIDRLPAKLASAAAESLSFCPC